MTFVCCLKSNAMNKTYFLVFEQAYGKVTNMLHTMLIMNYNIALPAQTECFICY